MPNIDDMKKSKYLTQRDCDPPITLTIESSGEEDVSMESGPADVKLVIRFQDEGIKPLVVNWTNQNLIAAATGSRVTEEWVGKPITLYRDPSIMYAGKPTGGIRIRVPDVAPASPLPTTAQQADYNAASDGEPKVDQDGIPF